jgi:hypothetical protein
VIGTPYQIFSLKGHPLMSVRFVKHRQQWEQGYIIFITH